MKDKRLNLLGISDFAITLAKSCEEAYQAQLEESRPQTKKIIARAGYARARQQNEVNDMREYARRYASTPTTSETFSCTNQKKVNKKVHTDRRSLAAQRKPKIY